MTGNLVIDTAISLAGIAVLVFLIRVLFPPPQKPLTEAEAAERLAFDEPDFVVATWTIDRNGKAALAESEAGEYALVFRLGADLVTRRFPHEAATLNRTDGVLTVKLPEHAIPPIRIRDVGPIDDVSN